MCPVRSESDVGSWLLFPKLGLIQVSALSSLRLLRCLTLVLQNLPHKLISTRISIPSNPVCFYVDPKLKTLPSNFFRKHEKTLDLTIQLILSLPLF